jgi:hypothetical protein
MDAEAILDFTNRELDDALAALVERDTSETRATFYAALLDSTVMLPAPKAATEEEDLPEDIPLVTLQSDSGATILIAFSNEEAIDAWEGDDFDFVGLRGLDLVLIAVQNDIDEVILNPASRARRHMSRETLTALARGEYASELAPSSGEVSLGTTVLIDRPEEAPPAAWRQTMVGLLKNYPSILSAYYFGLHLPKEGRRNVVGLALHPGMDVDAQERLMATLVEEVADLLPRDQTLDFVVLDAPDFLQTVADTVRPLYEAAAL